MSLFRCPVCKNELFEKENSYVCSSGHTFDKAKQGYVNLLMANKRHSATPGDSKEMVLSRRSFLESGKYDVFSNKLNEIIGEIFGGSQKLSILDCGCGEGYYDGRLTEYLEKLKINYKLFGFDISKEAVRFSAGKYKDLHLAVASCFDMPVLSNSFDLVVNIFSPMVEAELLRVLKTGGYLIYAVPGREHLMGLKKVVYKETYENEEKDTEYNGFEFIKRVSVKDNITVSGEEAVNLFKMTPYYYKTEKNACDKILNAGEINTEIHFDFLVYKKAREL